MMKNETIYLAKIMKLNDYAADTTIELEAFDTLDKAKGFMAYCGMVELSFGWVSPNSDWEGNIETLEVR
jgi:hypothetical protein